MAEDFFFSFRGRDGDGYSNRIGSPKYLAVDTGSNVMHRGQEIRWSDWSERVMAASGAVKGNPTNGIKAVAGHVLLFVHGFNTDGFDMLDRHRRIRDGLAAQGFPGAVVGLDWPSNGSVLGYSSDRADARRTAERLFDVGIGRFSRMQEADCIINLHVLAHSMGSYLIREAFDYADDDHATAQQSWTVSQMVFVASDVSSKSMKLGSPKTSSLLRHSTRLTNYYSTHDSVLSISEVKRIGVARRLGRVGLPDDHSEKAVDVYCGKFFEENEHLFQQDESISHRWYFDSPRFYQDLNHTLIGKLDRSAIPGRKKASRGGFAL